MNEAPAKPVLTQEVLARRWKGDRDMGPRPYIALLVQAEALAREVLLDPRVNQDWSGVQPKLLVALDAMEKTCLP